MIVTQFEVEVSVHKVSVIPFKVMKTLMCVCISVG